jgi:hypothetical protein
MGNRSWDSNRCVSFSSGDQCFIQQGEGYGSRDVRDQNSIFTGLGPGPNRDPKLYEIVNSVIFGQYLTQIFKKSSKKPSTRPPIFENIVDRPNFFDFGTPLNIIS